MIKVVSPQEYQEQLIKFRYLREQRDMYHSQLEIINASRANVMISKSTLENLKEGVKENDEILVPIGGIVNIKASIKEPEKVLLAYYVVLLSYQEIQSHLLNPFQLQHLG